MFSLDDLFTNIDCQELFDEEMPEGMVCLNNLAPGTEFRIGEEIFLLLENSGTGECRVIRKELLGTPMEFGGSANWADSPIRNYLNGDYFENIASVIGRENIIAMERDLTSLDGLDDYGRCVDNISMVTSAEYAKYRKILGVQPDYSNWWWTITPFSTPSVGYTRSVCCVNSYGALLWLGCGRRNGVRPFFTLNSSVLVSLFSENDAG